MIIRHWTAAMATALVGATLGCQQPPAASPVPEAEGVQESGYSVLQHSRRGVERQSKPIIKNRSDLERGDRDGRQFESRSDRRGDRDERRSERRFDRREHRRDDHRDDRRRHRRGDSDVFLFGGIGGGYYPYDYGIGGYSPYADIYGGYGGYGYLGSPLAYPPVTPYGAPMGAGAYGAQPGMVAQTTVVTMQDFQFQPQTVTVRTGGTVSWQNQGVTVHTATANNGEFDTGDVSPGQSSGGVTFNQPGVYQYTCQYHPQMKGTIVVQ